MNAAEQVIKTDDMGGIAYGLAFPLLQNRP
jgi:hypothetical protein